MEEKLFDVTLDERWAPFPDDRAVCSGRELQVLALATHPLTASELAAKWAEREVGGSWSGSAREATADDFCETAIIIVDGLPSTIGEMGL